MKTCSCCNTLKPFDSFYRDSNPRNKTGRQSRCIECAKAVSAAYRMAHPEWKREQDRAYRKRYPERQREQYAKKVSANPERYRVLANARAKRYSERNPGYRIKGNAERLRRWRKRHPEQERQRKVARRSVLRRIPVWGDKAMIHVVYQKARQYRMEVDHIVPLKHPLVCGMHVWHNLQLLEKSVNRKKRNREWPDMPDSTPRITTSSSITED